MTQTSPSLMEMLSELIAVPSMSSVSPEFDTSNREVIELLAEWLERLGFTVEILPLTTQPHKANLIATLGQGPGGLVLAGHTDTVPYDEGRWNHNPFRLTEKDDRLYGLGTSDMKGFFALAIEAARRFEAKQLKHPLIILATADEESSMDGARALVKLGRPEARYAVIGEPTGLRPVNAHKGIMMEAVRLTGRAGHSSDPSLGVNAIESMYRVLGDLLAWREELQAKHRDPQFKVPMPTLNLGHIHGGDNPNRICGHCELHFDLRDTLTGRLHRLLGESELGWELTPLIHSIPPMHTPNTSAIIQAAEKLTGHDSEAVAFCTEGPYLSEMGIETLILGPGDIAQAHQPDEYLALDRLKPTVELLKQLIDRFCL